MISSKFGILIPFPVENSLELFGNLNFPAEFGVAVKSPNTVQFLLEQGGKNAGFCTELSKETFVGRLKGISSMRLDED